MLLAGASPRGGLWLWWTLNDLERRNGRYIALFH